VAGIFVALRSQCPDFRPVDFEHFAEIAKRCNSIGALLAVHAEHDELVNARQLEVSSRGASDPPAWSEAHSPESEFSAVAVAREVCRSTGARIHVVNLSAGDSAAMVLQGMQEALPISSAVAPVHLEFTSAHLAEHGSRLKVIPALKEPGHNARLWEFLRDGAIDVVTAAHAAVQWPEEKSTDSIWKDRAGVPGIELTLPYLFSEGVCTGRISLERLVEVSAKNPARLLGIERIKGALEPGMHADFVVFDDNQSWTVQPTMLHGPNLFTPFEGMRFTGRVRATYQRGRCIFNRTPDGQEMFGPAGAGSWLQPGQRF
jgi:dihydroorotase-like cyclic amidohydrolase